MGLKPKALIIAFTIPSLGESISIRIPPRITHEKKWGMYTIVCTVLLYSGDLTSFNSSASDIAQILMKKILKNAIISVFHIICIVLGILKAYLKLYKPTHSAEKNDEFGRNSWKASSIPAIGTYLNIISNTSAGISIRCSGTSLLFNLKVFNLFQPSGSFIFIAGLLHSAGEYNNPFIHHGNYVILYCYTSH